MRSRRQDIELIEIFTTDDPLVDDLTPREKSAGRTLAIAAFVIATVVAVTVTWFGDDERSQEPATTTVLPTPTTERALLDPLDEATGHFLIEDPTLTPYSAEIFARPSEQEGFIAYTSAEREGPVVTIQFHPYVAFATRQATRSVVNGVELVSPLNHPTVYTAEVAIDDYLSATVWTSGLAAVDTAHLATDIAQSGGLTANMESDLQRSFGLVLAFRGREADDWIFGLVETSVRYLTDDGRVITLYSAPDSDQDFGKQGHRLFALQSLATDVEYSPDGRAYGHLIEGDDAIVLWVDDSGRLLSLVGPGDPADLVQFSRQARAATADEWRAMLRGRRPDYRVGAFAALATGVTPDGESWRAGIQLAERAGHTEFLWWWTVSGASDFSASTPASSAVGTRPHFDTLVVPGATFVFVSHPSVGGTVTVSTSTGATYVAELSQPVSSLPVNMAVVYVTEPGPVAVEIDGVPVTP